MGWIHRVWRNITIVYLPGHKDTKGMIRIRVIFTILNIILAFIDSRIIQEKHNILHGLNGAIYFIAVGLAVWWFNNYWLIGDLLSDRLLFFNIPLSLFRGLKWNYVSPAPKSITDKVAKWVFGTKGTLMYLVYAAIFAAFNIKIFV